MCGFPTKFPTKSNRCPIHLHRLLWMTITISKIPPEPTCRIKAMFSVASVSFSYDSGYFMAVYDAELLHALFSWTDRNGRDALAMIMMPPVVSTDVGLLRFRISPLNDRWAAEWTRHLAAKKETPSKRHGPEVTAEVNGKSASSDVVPHRARYSRRHMSGSVCSANEQTNCTGHHTPYHIVVIRVAYHKHV